MQASLTRKVGIEFECVSSRSHPWIADKLSSVGLVIDYDATGHYRCPNRCYSGWQVKSDTSILGEQNFSYGVELASPPITLSHTHGLRKALRVLRAVAKPNISCGTHVHVEAKELFAQLNTEHKYLVFDLLSAEWQKVRDLMFSYVPLSRRYNQYCLYDGAMPEHYNALNIGSNVTQTLEFRLHQGTLNPRKILAFATLCVAITEELVRYISAVVADGEGQAKSTPVDPLLLTRLEPTAFTNVPPKKLWLGNQVFHIQRVDKMWILEDRKRGFEYPTLLAAYMELRDKLKLGPDQLRAFRYPGHGNAMSLLCKTLSVYPTQMGYLEHRYEQMLDKFGPFDPNVQAMLQPNIAPDEVDFDELDDDQQVPESLTNLEMGRVRSMRR